MYTKAYTAVLVVRATRLVNGTPRFLDPQGSQTPEPIDIKVDDHDQDDVGNHKPHVNFIISTLKGVLVQPS